MKKTTIIPPARRERHGMCDTPIHNLWMNMKSRCYNPKRTGYEYYGGRGIKVCDEWNESFTAFYKYVGDIPEGCSLDRIDNNGNYEPGNVRWADGTTQNLNRRNLRNRKSGHQNIYMFPENEKQYGVMFTRHMSTVFVGNYYTLEDAILVRDTWVAVEKKLKEGGNEPR